MSGFPLFPKPDPGAHSNAPWDFATFLQKTADMKMVSAGPGGTTVVLDKDTLFAPPPSEEGIVGGKTSLPVKTGDPKLDEPAFAGLGLWSTQFATTVVYILVGTMKETPADTSEMVGGESLSATLAFREAALQQALEESGITSPETEPGAPAMGGVVAGVGEEGISEQAVDVNDTAANAAFVSWYQTMSQSLSVQLPPLSPATKSLLATMQSTDDGAILQSLIAMADIPSLNLSPAQQAVVESQLGILATTIGAANHVGGSFVLNMTVPSMMLPVMLTTLDVGTNTTMSAAEKGGLGSALFNICKQLARANFEDAVSSNPPSQEYTDLVSGNPQKVGTLLSTLTTTMPLPPGVSRDDLTGALHSITSSLCSLNQAGQQTLQSVDQEGLSTLFTQGLDEAVASGIITSDVKDKFIATLVPMLVSGVVDINQEKLTGDLSSQDPAAIEKSLTFLTKLPTDKTLNEPSRKIVRSYIQVLIAALVYMSNMRCLMNEMQTEFVQELATAKMANIAAQLKITQDAYVAALQKITTSYQANIASITHEHLMKVLGPLIQVLVGLIMLIIIIVCVIGEVFSLGADTPITVGVILATPAALAACIGAGVAVVAFAVTLASSICSWTTGSDMWTQLCKAMGITNQAIIDTISTVFQIVLQLVAIILTGGAMIAAAGLDVAVDLSATIAKTIVNQVIQVVVMNVLSDGLLMQGLQSLGNILFKNDAKMSAVFAMIVTIVITIVASLLMGGATQPKPGGGTAAALKATGKSLLSSLKKIDFSMDTIGADITQALKTVGGFFLDGAKDFLSSLKKTAMGWFTSTEKTGEIAKDATAQLGRTEKVMSFLKKQTQAAIDEAKDVVNNSQRLVDFSDVVFAGATVLYSLGKILLCTFITVLVVMLRGLINLCRNMLDHLVEAWKDWGSFQDIAKKLTNITELMKVVQFALQLTASVVQYEEAETEAYYDIQQASLAKEVSVLNATVKFFTDLDGLDQSQTITNISETAQEANENWQRLLKLVTEVIQDAGQRISEMATKAGM